MGNNQDVVESQVESPCPIELDRKSGRFRALCGSFSHFLSFSWRFVENSNIKYIHAGTLLGWEIPKKFQKKDNIIRHANVKLAQAGILLEWVTPDKFHKKDNNTMRHVKPKNPDGSPVRTPHVIISPISSSGRCSKIVAKSQREEQDLKTTIDEFWNGGLPPINFFIPNSSRIEVEFGGFTGFGRRSARKGESYLHSERAPVLTSDQNAVTSDPTGKGNVVEASKERSRTTTKEPKKPLVQSYHSCEARKPNSNDEKKR
ncbi:hypothetical protein M5K25_014263 [Dendrobium thyrsiflorum]|uniref:Uncharacterized protein n=1 Tax=Dendrobium thyrsiflorum TaxID=117978 RepID=A0ABD0UV16_DENTH